MAKVKVIKSRKKCPNCGKQSTEIIQDVNGNDVYRCKKCIFHW